MISAPRMLKPTSSAAAFIADEDGGQPGVGQQAGAGLQDAGVGALGKDNALGGLFQGVDELLKHVNGHWYLPPS